MVGWYHTAGGYVDPDDGSGHWMAGARMDALMQPTHGVARNARPGLHAHETSY